jgi:GAF domain-containing protein
MAIPAPLALNEQDRLAVLRGFAILDTPPEPLFDDLAGIAASICGTPIASVTLLDEHRQWHKARVGLAAAEGPRDEAFCAHTILADGVMIVPDATRDPRFAANPGVLGDPFIRFYAGAPLEVAGGYRLGTLCVIDRSPRQLSDSQVAALTALSRQAAALLELRRANAELSDALSRVRVLEGFIPICAYCRRVRDDGDYWQQVEEYLEQRTASQFTHGICPGCAATHFPDEVADLSRGSI